MTTEFMSRPAAFAAAKEADPSRRLRRIVVVGGGVAGWMAAVYLNRVARPLRCEVTLVEPSKIETKSVGESTTPTLVHFVRTLGLDEVDLMRRCTATFKLGTRFDDWVEDGAAYWHPYGACGAPVNGIDFFHLWLKRRLEAGSKLNYSDFSLQGALAESEKAPWPWAGSSAVFSSGAYAYHLDAAAFADHLKERATREGVMHLFGDVQDVAVDSEGLISSVNIGAERVIAGDLFIDAAGSPGALIEKALGDPWIDWSQSVLCDSAVEMPLPRGQTFAPFTISKAMPAGWIWRIPLSTRTGNGYAFSSAHCATDEAIASLIERSGLPRARSADPRVFKNRVGRRTNFWAGNCVSIGSSAGFVEPLESTSLHLIQRAVLTLADYLPDRNFSPALRRAFNARMAEAYEEARDFIVLHYHLSRRNEPFWRDARSVPLSEWLRGVLELYDETGRIGSPRMQAFPESSYYFLLTGAGRVPRRLVHEAAAARPSDVWHALDRTLAESRREAERMPTHVSYLGRLHQTTVLNALQRRPGAEAPAMSPDNELVRRIHGLGAPYGLERSAKFEDGAFLDDRFLLSLHRAALGPDPLARLASLGAEFGAPQEFVLAFESALRGADIVHFGYEGAAGSEVFKFYFEYVARVRAAMDAADPQATLVHLAFKWDRLDREKRATSRYVWTPRRTRGDVEARIQQLTPASAAPRALRCAAALLDRAGPLTQSRSVLMMEVEEPGNPRRSWDLNVYAADLKLRDVSAMIDLAANQFSAPRSRVDHVFGDGRRPLGHLAGGVGRGGKEFVTVYYGKESRQGAKL